MSKSKVSFKGKAHGLRFEVVETDMGHRCGYVEVPEGNPVWSVEDYMGKDYPDLSVHGGVTFVGWRISSEGLVAGETWWVGFDCAHHMDSPDPKLKTNDNAIMYDYRNDGIVRSEAYVIEECEKLAEQIAGLKEEV